MKGKFCRLRFALFAAVLPALSHGGGAKLAPGDIDAADLTPLKTPNRASGAPVKWIEDGTALLPIVCGGDYASRRAAQLLATSVEMMTGVIPKVMPRRHDTRKPDGAAAVTMRELPRMQEAGWSRQWRSGEVSNKNVCEISYPRREVLRMEELSAAGRFWSGNFCRGRAPRPGDKERRKGIGSFSRLYTRGSGWNKNPSAFGKLQFME